MKDLTGSTAPLRPETRGQAGFSLIEILVSAVITALLATSAFYFLSSQSGAGTAGTDAMKSVNLGKLKLDSLKVSDYAVLSSGSDTVSGRYIRAWHVTLMRDDHNVPNGRKKIDMSVMWPLTAEHSVTLATLKSDDTFREGTP